MTSLENILNKLYNKKNYLICIIAIIILCIGIYLFTYREKFDVVTPTASLNNGSYTIKFTEGQSGTWTVPDGVTSATFTVVGGKGSDRLNLKGGLGAYIISILNVNPSEKYNIYVGNSANSYNGGLSTIPLNIGSGGNGGGTVGGGGGSVSAVYLNITPIIVAGGGGGSSNTLSGINSTKVITTITSISIISGKDRSNNLGIFCGGNGGGMYDETNISDICMDTSGTLIPGNGGTSLVPSDYQLSDLSDGNPFITIKYIIAPTPTSTPTATLTSSPTSSPTSTPTATQTSTSNPTQTSTPTATLTLSPTATLTSSPTQTSIGSDLTTPTATPTTPYITTPSTTLFNMNTNSNPSQIKPNIDINRKFNIEKNVDNLNDFLANNTIFGSNLYISPMNSTGIDKVKNKKEYNNNKIDSNFFPIVKI